jgi:hypothetical protein
MSEPEPAILPLSARNFTVDEKPVITLEIAVDLPPSQN